MAAEIERKFKVDLSIWKNYLDANKKILIQEKIEQIYIEKSKEKELRIRRILNRTNGDEIYFTKTMKLGSGIVRDEFEDDITETEFLKLKEQGICTVFKTRYSIPETTMCFDVYDKVEKITFEIEFDNEEEAYAYTIPEELASLIVEEVSGNKDFSNFTIGLLQKELN
jgi:CYTH domain-containing protein